MVPSVVLEMNEGASCEESLRIPNGRGEPSNRGRKSEILSSLFSI